MAISVGSVEVDVIPNTNGIYNRLRGALVPAATRAGDDAGRAAGRSFGPAMSGAVDDTVAARIGQQLGQQIAARIAAQVRGSLTQGIRQGGAAARGSATQQGNEAGGAFGTMFRRRVQAALAALPDIDIDADTTEADADIRALRVQLETLTGQRVGIDVDAVTARRQIDELERELTRLGTSHPDISVRMNTAAATAQLAALRAEIDALDGRDVNVRVDPTIRSFGLLVTAAAAFGPAILPALPVVAAGLGAVAAAGVAAGVGLGAVAAVALPALKDIGGALQAQKAAQDAASAATLKGAQSTGQGAAKALQMAGAQQALASAHRNAARQIDQAEQSVADAVRSSAEASVQAAQQVKTSRKALADAVQQAADRQRDAAERVSQAEDSLADSQRSARQAQVDLTQARKDAAADLAALADRVANAQLSERDAVLDVQEARDRLQAVQAVGSKATVVEQQRAQLAYDQAVQRLKEQQAETKALAGEKATADKAGIEGSDLVKAAQERIAEAEKTVADQQKALGKARDESARLQVKNQQDIAGAQEKVAESQRNVTKVQEDGARAVASAQESLAAAQASAADSISTAQRQIASASQTAAGGVDQAAVAQANYQAQLDKLTPSARGTFDAFVELKSAFTDWSESLQPQVMPIFTRALVGLRDALPSLTPFVLAAASAIGTLQDKASAGFKSPWWKSFKEDLAGSVEPAIVGLGVSFGNIFKGMAGIIQAFLPHMDGVSQSMQGITARFATWGSNLKGSPAFERFLSYSSEQAPLLAETLGNLLAAVLHLGVALAPMAGTAQSFINALATGISAIPTNVLTVIGVAFASIAIGAKLAALAMGIWRGAVMAAGLVTALMTGETIALNAAMRANLIGLIVTAILALVVAIVYAYQNCETFRNIVDTVWSALQTGALFVWNTVLKPIFSALVTGFQAIGAAATWLWDTILSPVFGFIGAAAQILATIVLTILITPFVLAFQALAAVATWLWDIILSPVFGWIGDAATTLWTEKISPAWELIKIGTGLLAAKIKELWDTYAKPIFGWIGDKATKLWTDTIKPAWVLFKAGIGLLGEKVQDLWDDYAKPVFDSIAEKGKWLWEKALKPAFDNMKEGIAAVGTSFGDAKSFIKTAWDQVKNIAKTPVKFVIDKVYNGGIVPTWNLIAKAFGAPKLKPMETKGWATGGVLPGYSPGKDIHKFVSPTGGGLELSGGEAIMRPEFTRAVGSGFVSTMNKIATTRGATGVKAALAPALGGNETTQRFASGGIFGWIGKKAAGAGSAAWDGVKKGASWLKDGLEASARAGVNGVVNPLLAKFPGASGDFGQMIRKIPNSILDSLFGYSKKADEKGAGGVGGPRIQSALRWAKTQAGLPYQWAGNGNPSWDCSGFMSAIESKIRGQKPHRRWATGAFSGKQAPPGWVLNAKSPFQIGITNSGVGHTAGTIGGTNVESRGGDGVTVGPRARGWNDKLFTSHYGFKPGSYDSGGYLQPGMNLAYNGTGKPEPVFTTGQANALARGGPAGGALSLDGQQLQLVLDDGQRFNAHVEALADGRVQAANGQLVQVLNAGGGL
ncbi:hypothetical protein [Streptomyces sp. NPDC048462]|uniref:hypothetical protein n=1 Tax=Streptomyces sp. NPDC048462 TaxID=3365555 RepID=UPI00371F31C2